jgi:hypothetical protein
METKLLNNSQQKIPFHFIKGLVRININCQKSTSSSLRFEGMQHLMSQVEVILNMAIRNKSRLKMRYNVKEKRLEPVGKQLGDNLVDNIAETNRKKMLNRGSTQLFWDQSCERVVLFSEKVIVLEKKFKTACTTVCLIVSQYFI